MLPLLLLLSTFASPPVELAPDPGATDEDEAAANPASVPCLLDIGLITASTSSAREPETALPVDPDTGLWQTASLLRPRRQHSYPPAALAIAVELEPKDGLVLRALLDSGEL